MTLLKIPVIQSFVLIYYDIYFAHFDSLYTITIVSQLIILIFQLT